MNLFGPPVASRRAGMGRLIKVLPKRGCMKRSWRSLQYGVALMVFGVVAAYAGPGQGHTTGRPIYRPKTETTINAVVQEIREVPGPRRGTGTHLTVKVGNDAYDVRVGPTWYVTQEKFAFAKDDQIEVTGSKVKYQGSDAIIARQIKKDGSTLTLRDAQGTPLWSRRM